MSSIAKLLEQYSQLHGQMLEDIKTWRSGGWRLLRNNEDITERWLQDQQTRAEELGSLVAPVEKPTLYLYGDY